MDDIRLALQWIADNWVVLSLIIGALISIFNFISKHTSQHYGIMKVITWITERLSILCSVGARIEKLGKLGKFKLPLMSVKPGSKK